MSIPILPGKPSSELHKSFNFPVSLPLSDSISLTSFPVHFITESAWSIPPSMGRFSGGRSIQKQCGISTYMDTLNTWAGSGRNNNGHGTGLLYGEAS